MKKIIGLLGTIILAAAMILPVHADENLQVTYQVANTYTVTIPATVTLGDSAQNVNISAKHDIEPGKTLNVKVKSGINNSAIVLTRSGDSGTKANASVTAKKGSTTISNVSEGTVLASFSGFSETSVTGGTLTISKPASAKAGTYSGTVVFSVAVE